jgi:hypothetical protein
MRVPDFGSWLFFFFPGTALSLFTTIHYWWLIREAVTMESVFLFGDHRQNEHMATPEDGGSRHAWIQ